MDFISCNFRIYNFSQTLKPIYGRVNNEMTHDDSLRFILLFSCNLFSPVILFSTTNLHSMSDVEVIMYKASLRG